MGIASTVMTALTALVSLAVGALLQHALGRRAEERKQRELLRASAYADFLRGVSLLATTHRTDASQQRVFEGMALVGDARARIALYGSDAMVRAMAGLAEYPELATRKACEAFIRACRQMRFDTHASVALTDEELSLTIFGRSLAGFDDEQGPRPSR
jgi:hypothetical protein